ncbi:DNA starvation/stationary phase protection protein [Patulibacter sp. NPDC049589]|uniref:Dps family protein n=1 Tax=Patulibacter sp. NPDC049589 TaxID=3154731 RepID=UPI00343A4677
MTPTSTSTTSPAPAFRADEALADRLQRVHVELIDLHLQGKQAHWNVVGRNFRDLHLQLDELVAVARGFSDDLAERMRALYVTPDGRPGTVAEQSSLPPFPAGEVDTAETVDLITGRIYGVCSTIREVHDDVDEADPTTADQFHGFLERFEQLAWMVSAENRVADRTDPRPIHE